MALAGSVSAVKELFTHKEFQDVLKEAGGRPVVIDYYSNSCGPCHMIAPVYRKISKQFAGRAYFRKVDVNRNRETSSAQRISSMPTFQFFMKGKKVHQFSGADENSLRMWTQKLVDQADREDVIVTREDLMEFYKKHDESKATDESIDNIMKKNSKDFAKMASLLKKKYGEAPKTQQAPKPEKAKKDTEGSSKGSDKDKGTGIKSATIEELREELERREEDAAVEKQDYEDKLLENNPCSLNRNRTEGAVEKVVIIGGGPAGMTAAIYAARANLCPLVLAPKLGGQLMAKGVDVENYPGMPRENGGKMIEIMKAQARGFFAEVLDDSVLSLNASVSMNGSVSRPFQIQTNRTGVIKAHTIIIATGADSKWLDKDGEWEYRGHGVSSCAACDGYLFRGKSCAVVGGGDTAMEEALMLSRICSEVTLVHRRDSFRASSVLQQRVLENKNINVRWNTEVIKFDGKMEKTENGEEVKVLTNVELRDLVEGTMTSLPIDAAFVAIGHIPNTGFVSGVVEMDKNGYIELPGRSTRTSVPGIFAAGDVSDHVYRQAITSAGSGSMAALDVEKYLSENPIDDHCEVEKCVVQEDFGTWSVKELRHHLGYLGIKCVGCSEKSDFSDKLKAQY